MNAATGYLDPQGHQRLVPAEQIVRLEGVSKTFAGRHGAPVTALEGIDLAVPQGSVLGVIGRSGAGKSTLIRLVNGLEKPSSGRVIVDGADIAALPEAALRHARRSIGMIFQHFNLLSSRTAADNIALPLEVAGFDKAAIKSRVGELLALVGLSDKHNRYPAELSGGQKQRVGIARALATNPKVLLSDEATSALDPETTRSILDLLARINAELGLTILLITHEMAVIRSIAREVAVIEGGRIVEKGNVFDVFTRPQHEVTRSFLADETGRALPAYVASRIQPEAVAGGQAILRIGFRGPHATDPVLARLARDLDIEANILAGSVDEIAGRPCGILVIGVPEASLGPTLTFLKQYGLDTEVLGHVA
ncbi:methionine ABC transporter ATP-binding protein [Microvirga brassicacearum]|uniref:Cell division ATP-binding protein FtsE n=1 Tax=Microvirga brassicacearum TaxID=2580413 RepID=A0A5N3P3G5_9HYPH|nr:methionine ABC transporter ATP-binding protein [Microvirga brassicacearum]KAB0264262.1 methionine ABC transporter ATP-binding protein [Microvirga brassicacearum]